ncbi:MAG: hypothetical protein M1473_04055 [Firmicutes bacterium]|nr:hypothetical protein [Bacillota bacterium]
MHTDKPQCFTEIVEQVVAEQQTMKTSMERIAKAIFEEEWTIRRIHFEPEDEATVAIALALTALVSKPEFVDSAKEQFGLDFDATKAALTSFYIFEGELSEAIEALKGLLGECKNETIRDMILSWLFYLESILKERILLYKNAIKAAVVADEHRKELEKEKFQEERRLQEEKRLQEERNRHNGIDTPNSTTKPGW